MGILEQPLVFVDIETNGLNHIRGRVIEVAAIRVESGGITREFRTLIDPGAPLPQFITNLTGIAPSDLTDAPLFMAIADQLHEILDGALFVAHNVRFDYSFLKQEFKRVGISFCPRQLCTVRLSRALFPEQRSHKLQELIRRHNLQVSARHRAYDDAHALWQFMRLVQSQFPAEIIEKAIAKQVKQPSLPKALDPDVVASLPEGPGVYIMYDKLGSPLYVGKSIHIRQRVLEHFMRDHDNAGEFKLSQGVNSIAAHETSGELEALLLESQFVKELLPLHNKRLRKIEKMLLAIKEYDGQGYIRLRVELADLETARTNEDIIGVYEQRGALRNSLENAAREWNLCPVLLGLEKSTRACFWSQLGKCRGACIGKEKADEYNARLLLAFQRQPVEPWPYSGPILIQERQAPAGSQTGLLVDRWRLVGKLRQDEGCEPVLEPYPAAFDLDTYNILRSYLTTKLHNLYVQTLSTRQLEDMEP